MDGPIRWCPTGGDADFDGKAGFDKVAKVSLLDQRTSQSWSGEVGYSPAASCVGCSSDYSFDLATGYSVLSGDTMTATFFGNDGSAVACDFVYRITTFGVGSGGVHSIDEFGCRLMQVPAGP